MIRWTSVGTPLGPILLAATEHGLCACDFCDGEAEDCAGSFAGGSAVQDPRGLAEEAEQVRAYFAGDLLGAVTYADSAKTNLLGVPADTLEQNGAVSEPVARAMAEGVRRQAGSSLGLAITGIAGPHGGSADKPVGTVFVALAEADGTWCHRLNLGGDRAVIRWRASQDALTTIRRYVLGGAAAL